MSNILRVNNMCETNTLYTTGRLVAWAAWAYHQSTQACKCSAGAIPEPITLPTGRLNKNFSSSVSSITKGTSKASYGVADVRKSHDFRW